MIVGTLRRGLIVLCLLGARPALAEGPVTLVPQPKIAGAAAFPRIAAPLDEAGKRINAALDRQDQQLRKAAAECRTQGGKAASWDRTVTVPMSGPGFLALLAADSLDCGGAHPDTATLALVYDLQTGRPVNWARLLPAELVGKAALDDAADGSKIGTITSPKLVALYAQGYPASSDRAECLDAVGDGPFILWLDVKAAGLVVAPSSLPHAVAACGAQVTLPVAMLRTLGADARLTEAIDAAHKPR